MVFVYTTPKVVAAAEGVLRPLNLMFRSFLEPLYGLSVVLFCFPAVIVARSESVLCVTVTCIGFCLQILDAHAYQTRIGW